MKQTVTVEIEDSAALRILRELAALNIIRIGTEISLQDAEQEAEKAAQDKLITARLNEIYETVDSSLEPCFVMAQAEVYGKEDW
jgi:hypothetical protein